MSICHKDEDIRIIKRSDNWAAIALNGPRSRAILSSCTAVDLSNAGFRWLSAQQIELAGQPLWAFRMSYAGELGWELHGPRDGIKAAYGAIWAAGTGLGLVDYGAFGMNALRMEKGFKATGELTNEVTLPEADAMRIVRLDKAYLGDAATRASAGADLPWVCAYLQIAPNGVEDGHGGEAMLLDGTVVGATASVAYGHTVGKILAFAYVKPYVNVAGTALEVVIAGRKRAAVVLGAPAYGPENTKPRTDG